LRTSTKSTRKSGSGACEWTPASGTSRRFRKSPELSAILPCPFGGTLASFSPLFHSTLSRTTSSRRREAASRASSLFASVPKTRASQATTGNGARTRDIQHHIDDRISRRSRADRPGLAIIIQETQDEDDQRNTAQRTHVPAFHAGRRAPVPPMRRSQPSS
jgi:hypothetical protein